jgi:hypothetical protein
LAHLCPQKACQDFNRSRTKCRSTRRDLTFSLGRVLQSIRSSQLFSSLISFLKIL